MFLPGGTAYAKALQRETVWQEELGEGRRGNTEEEGGCEVRLKGRQG